MCVCGVRGGAMRHAGGGAWVTSTIRLTRATSSKRAFRCRDCCGGCGVVLFCSRRQCNCENNKGTFLIGLAILPLSFFFLLYFSGRHFVLAARWRSAPGPVARCKPPESAIASGMALQNEKHRHGTRLLGDANHG